ncbi:MAG: LacI family transcriptional regulator, partial [Ruthenibacterium sp.]
MKQRRFFPAVILCLALTAALFAGCGDKEKPASSSSTASGKPSSSMTSSMPQSGSGSLGTAQSGSMS